MNRIRKIKYGGQKWTIQALVPADFLEVSYWPFAYYKLPESELSKNAEIKRDWKLKPKGMVEEEKQLEDSFKLALKLGAGINDKNYAQVKKNAEFYNILLSEIYALTYQLTPEEKFFIPQKVISKTFAEFMFAKAKAMNMEPYAFMADLAREKPELYNPKRFDFNIFILGVGWERERREMEKAEAKMKAATKKMRKKKMRKR